MSTREFAMLLEAGDVERLRAAWHKVAPQLPQPETREQAEIVMHMARTSSAAVAFRARAWSHCWLQERCLPSQLPEILRPKAERMFLPPQMGVAIAVGAPRILGDNPELKPAFAEIRGAMETAVLEMHGDRVPLDAPIVKQRMMEARARTRRVLFGR